MTEPKEQADIPLVVQCLYPKDDQGNYVKFCPVTPPAEINRDSRAHLGDGVVHRRYRAFAPCVSHCQWFDHSDGKCGLPKKSLDNSNPIN